MQFIISGPLIRTGVRLRGQQEASPGTSPHISIQEHPGVSRSIQEKQQAPPTPTAMSNSSTTTTTATSSRDTVTRVVTATVTNTRIIVTQAPQEPPHSQTMAVLRPLTITQRGREPWWIHQKMKKRRKKRFENISGTFKALVIYVFLGRLIGTVWLMMSSKKN